MAFTLVALSSAQVHAQDAARPTIQLQLSAAEPGETWFAQHGSREPVRLCDAPCSLKIKADTLRFGIAQANQAPDFDEQVLPLRESSTLHIVRVSRRGKRIGGAVLALGSVLFGTVGLIAAGTRATLEDFGLCTVEDPCDNKEPKLGAGAWVWVGLNVATLIGGLVLMFQRDEVHVTATPLSATEPAARPEPAVTEHAHDEPREKPRFAPLSPAVWSCLREANASEATLALTFDAAHTLRQVYVQDVPAAQACVSHALAGQRIEHAPAGEKVLRFHVPQ